MDPVFADKTPEQISHEFRVGKQQLVTLVIFHGYSVAQAAALIRYHRAEVDRAYQGRGRQVGSSSQLLNCCKPRIPQFAGMDRVGGVLCFNKSRIEYSAINLLKTRVEQQAL